jgi:hypothetical protein
MEQASKRSEVKPGGRGALNRGVEGLAWKRQRQESKMVKVWSRADVCEDETSSVADRRA